MSQDATPSVFRAPRFIRRLFDHFPLFTYPVDPPPMTARELSTTTSDLNGLNQSGVNTLYIFTESDGGQEASFNPACLKWQTYLKIRGIPFTIYPSNNHASPTGALPFMTVAQPSSPPSTDRKPATVIPSTKLTQWIEENALGSVNTVDADTGDYRAFMSLVDGGIRVAWLYALYADTENLYKITVPRYTSTTPQWPIPHLQGAQMRQAALAQIRLLSSSEAGGSLPTGQEIYKTAETAWSALSTLLGGDEWFFGAPEAGLFDAAVFAYTHLILTLDIQGSGRQLVEGLKGFENLVEHEDRIRRRWF